MWTLPLARFGFGSEERHNIMRVIRGGLLKPAQTSTLLKTISGCTYHSSYVIRSIHSAYIVNYSNLFTEQSSHCRFLEVIEGLRKESHNSPHI